MVPFITGLKRRRLLPPIVCIMLVAVVSAGCTSTSTVLLPVDQYVSGRPDSTGNQRSGTIVECRTMGDSVVRYDRNGGRVVVSRHSRDTLIVGRTIEGSMVAHSLDKVRSVTVAETVPDARSTWLLVAAIGFAVIVGIALFAPSGWFDVSGYY